MPGQPKQQPIAGYVQHRSTESAPLIWVHCGPVLATMLIARKHLVDDSAPGCIHCFPRCVRHAFLCGDAAKHRRDWARDAIRSAAGPFIVDVLAYAVRTTSTSSSAPIRSASPNGRPTSSPAVGRLPIPRWRPSRLERTRSRGACRRCRLASRNDTLAEVYRLKETFRDLYRHPDLAAGNQRGLEVTRPPADCAKTGQNG